MNAKRLFLGLLTATVVVAPLTTLNPANAMPHNQGQSQSTKERHEHGEKQVNQQQSNAVFTNAKKKDSKIDKQTAMKQQNNKSHSSTTQGSSSEKKANASDKYKQ